VETGAEPTAAAKGSQSGFNWGLFPDIPEEQRPLLEPHLKNVQGHVTKLEQQLSSFKDVTPEQVQGLVGFQQAFDADPMGVWLNMGQKLQETGLMSDLDFEALTAIAKGEYVDEEEGAAEGQPPEGGEVDDRYARLEAEIQAMKQQRQMEETQRRQRVEAQLLERSLDGMRARLNEAGIGEVDDKTLVAHIIAAQGNSQVAVDSILSLHQNALKGLTSRKRESEDGVEMPNGAPKAKERPKGRDGWSQAKAGAANYLNKVAEGS
jgi:hypothetical protein